MIELTERENMAYAKGEEDEQERILGLVDELKSNTEKGCYFDEGYKTCKRELKQKIEEE